MAKYAALIRLFLWFFVLLYISIGSKDEFPYLFYPLRILVILMILVETAAICKKVFYGSFPDGLKNTILSLASFLVIFLLIDILFMFVPRTHGIGSTYANSIWFQYYWRPINSFGFRDKEPDLGKESILFVGDSFTAGYGIKSISDRYSDLVEEGNTRGLQSINLGLNGADTEREFEMMLDFVEETKVPVKKIVLQYFGNDIEDTAYELGLNITKTKPYAGDNFIVEYLARGTFFGNFVYWMFPKNGGEAYEEFLKEAYQDEVVLEKHLEDLQGFVDYAESKEIELTVLVFPFLQEINESKHLYTDKITAFFEEKGVHVLDVGEMVAGLPLRKRIVNYSDTHPSVIVHQKLADALINHINN
jgi:hypothetical protein